MLNGLLNIIICIVAFATPGIRTVELDLPDHVAGAEPEAAKGLVEPAE